METFFGGSDEAGLAKRMGLSPSRVSGAVGGGKIRIQPEDFLVEEILGFEPEGAGPHLWIEIEKRACDHHGAQPTPEQGFFRS